jgi:hypothetical protein
MRIWSLHPRHLDRVGLVACWRETLLAQAVLAGETRGYRQHPQLERFRDQADPLIAIGAYLSGLGDEAAVRGYRFNRDKIRRPGVHIPLLEITTGQLEYEWTHLGGKLARRSPTDAERWRADTPTPHPLFVVKPGGMEAWERL